MDESSTGIAYFLSSSTRPHYGKASPIQKGIVPSKEQGNADLCEEGVGFGVPLLQYRRDFFFPGTSVTSDEGVLRNRHVWKRFGINLVERHQTSRSGTIQAFSWIYQRMYNRIYKSQHGRKILELIEFRTRKRGERAGRSPSMFFNVKSKGEVLVSYDMDTDNGRILTSLDFSEVVRSNLQHIYVCNELGGSLFDHYIDSSGSRLIGEEIGGWDRINADWAAFCSPTKKIGFQVEIPSEAEAFRGRELIRPDICWSGIIFMLSPSLERLQYSINLKPCKKWW